MGLDIFLYKIIKPNLDTSKTYTPDLLDELDASFHSVEDNKREERIPQHMVDNLTQIVNVECDYFDNRLLFKEFQKTYPDLYPGSADDYFNNAFETKDFPPRKLSITLTGSSYTSDEVAYTFADYNNKDANHDRPSIRISAATYKEVKEAYMTQKVEPHYVWYSQEVDYQRKGLTEEGWGLLPGNCFYEFDKSVVEALTYEGLDDSFLDNWVEGETALVAWW